MLEYNSFMSKPSIPKGTRDFSPSEMVRRNYIFSTIKQSFQRYGFMPIETPSMELSKTLMGKYGEEGDRLIFKILESGEYLKKRNLPVDFSVLVENAANQLFPKTWDELAENTGTTITEIVKELTPTISEKALRYDLTVPFARYVVQHQNEITFPFKRYQIQPVWRADRPQRGRYREFYQCDADIVGTDSLICEADIILIINEVLGKLGITDFNIKINNRKILSGIAEYLGLSLIHI